MSFSLTPITQSNYWTRYLVEYDGSGPQELIIPNATLVADSRRYLRELFDFSGTNQEVLERIVPILQVILVPAGDTPDSWSFLINVDGDGRPFVKVIKASPVNGAALVDLRYLHSMIR
jgi:hypothetical protein